MQNLAGNEKCDDFIQQELKRARIDIVWGTRSAHEVAASATGQLGKITFRRAWYYWIANGPIPLEVARELYTDPVGQTDIRVAGHCGCPPPEEPWLTYRTPDGREVRRASEEREMIEMVSRHDYMVQSWEKRKQEVVFAEDRAAAGQAFVECYHIDTEVGLRLFADTLRRHGLADGQAIASPLSA